jgi:lipoic acid synthetase
MRLDPLEPANVGRMAASMHLRYVVITSVNRDDLPDGGSAHFAETVRQVRRALPDARVEVLTPDFCGDLDAVARVLQAEPHVFNHNMETVPRLYRRVRPQADYRQSLRVLAFAREHTSGVLTKSGFMVGLGETEDEVHALLGDLRNAGTDVATIGQYLQPTRRNLPVAAYIEPQQFERYREYGLSLGFKMVFSGPLVRSSYMADAVHEEARRVPC